MRREPVFVFLLDPLPRNLLAMEVRFAGEEKKMDATEHATEEAALENIIAGCIRGATPPPTTYIVKGWEVAPRTCKALGECKVTSEPVYSLSPLVTDHRKGLAMTPRAALRLALGMWMPDENRATFRNDYVAVLVTIRWSVDKVQAEITTDYRRAVSLRG